MFTEGNTIGHKFDSERRSEYRYVLHPQGLRRCRKCGSVKSLNEFPSKGHNRLNANCKTCENERLAGFRERQKREPILYCRVLLPSLRNRAKELSVPFSLTAEELFELWKQQQGKCFYTGLDMNLLAFNPDRTSPHTTFPSVDRLVPEDGYVVSNVVWCLWAVNRMKSNLTKVEFVEFCQLVCKNHA